MEANLLIVKEDGTSQEIHLRKPRVVVGRESDCELRIPLPSVSRQHCEFILDNGKVTVRDLGSSNGTYVNKQRVEEAELSAGDLIAVGPAVFALILNGEPSGLDMKAVFAEGTVVVKPKKHAGLTGNAAKAAAALAGGKKNKDDSDLDIDASSDDSSMIDFDFDFDDDEDEQPKL